jgi:uncharacterized protein (DUF608 family)
MPARPRRKRAVRTSLPYSRRELHDTDAVRTYAGEQLRELAVPIGGIGAGCVSLAGWGELRDWEIYNSPGKGNVNHNAFFTLHCRAAKGGSVTKVLQGPVMREYGRGGHGYYRESGAGLPHFRRCEMTVAYPTSWLTLDDDEMPLKAVLQAWNPLIPGNDRDSSIPCAIFEWTITNPTRRTLDCTLLANLSNTVGYPEVGKHLNRYRQGEGVRGLEMLTRAHRKRDLGYGSMALTTPHDDVTHLVHWRRGYWFDGPTDFWAQAVTGQLDESVQASATEAHGPCGETGSIGARFRLKGGQRRTIPVLITWLMPNARIRFGGHDPSKPGADCMDFKTYAATQWRDAWDVAEYVAGDLDRLRRQTQLYQETLADTTLPGHVVEAAMASASILKTPTCVRLTNGDFWAWEGTHDQQGCCPGTCTHVWNYQQALPVLFPALERNIRETDYRANLHADGSMDFRQKLPIAPPRNGQGHAAADGQMGGVVKTYREWRMCGDDDWLRSLWPDVKRSLEYAWDAWDVDRDGVMEASQHNTYDINFWGPNTMTGAIYLAALRAAEEMARHLGDDQTADACRELFRRGSAWTDEHLFNGEYYTQQVNPDAWSVGLSDQQRRATLLDPLLLVDGHPKYQYGQGCLTDQLLGQYMAELVELGDLYRPENVDRAVASIFAANFRTGFYEHRNTQRVFALDDEAGTVLCTWPRGQAEAFPFPYSDEVWPGFEYAFAALLAARGRSDEASAVVKAVRDRYDGVRRNPYDEVECGHHYARSMSAWGVLLAMSGFVADLPNKRLRFAPRVGRDGFATFWAVDGAWGMFSQQDPDGALEARLEVRHGSLTLKRLSLDIPDGRPVEVRAAGRSVEATSQADSSGLEIVLRRQVRLRAGRELVVSRRAR